MTPVAMLRDIITKLEALRKQLPTNYSAGTNSAETSTQNRGTNVEPKRKRPKNTAYGQTDKTGKMRVRVTPPGTDATNLKPSAPEYTGYD